jgi:hypothetical protein
MIHHVSIPASEPAAVAEALAELMRGRVFPFPGPVPGAFMAVSGDEHGTMIEVYPEGSVLRPGSGEEEVKLESGTPAPGHAFHLLLSVPADQDTVERIGQRMGWRAQLCGRGAPGEEPLFHVIELWVENRLMVEVVTPEMVPAYTKLVQFPVLDTLFSEARAA